MKVIITQGTSPFFEHREHWKPFKKQKYILKFKIEDCEEYCEEFSTYFVDVDNWRELTALAETEQMLNFAGVRNE